MSNLYAQDYFPFGSVMDDRSYNNYKYRFAFQGQEKENDIGEGEHYAFKYRIHDSRLGRFLSIDPLAPEYPWNSPYAFSENSVIAFFELEGLEKISIHTHSFAPFNTFGGGFMGDGADRTFGLIDEASSRLKSTVNLNVDAQTDNIEILSTEKEGSFSFHPTLGGTYSEAELETEVSELTTNNSGFTTANLDIDLSGSMDLIPIISPDINVKLTMEISVHDLSEGTTDGGSIISIVGTVYGDKFPASENYLKDEKGVGIFLGVSGADGNPLTALPGDDNDRAVASYNIRVVFDKDDNLKSVINGAGKKFTVEEWNQQFFSLDPQDGKVATER